jgi:1-acyl-sn-glycerol-3-phosphate acyltransferase
VAHLRALAALLAFALVVYLPATVQLYAIIGWSALVGTPRTTHRRRVGRWRLQWSRVLLWIMRRILDTRTDIKLPGDDPSVYDNPDYVPLPCIFVANHRSTLDIFVINEVARRMGLRDVRWVLKTPLRRRSGIIGRSCAETECAFVKRGHAGDLDEISRAARVAYADQASIVIFPEGTRFRSERAKDFANVLNPRPNGLHRLLCDMPGYRIVAVTLDWDAAGEARTTLQNASLAGRKLSVTTSVHEVAPEQAGEWLAAEWARKEHALAPQIID